MQPFTGLILEGLIPTVHHASLYEPNGPIVSQTIDASILLMFGNMHEFMWRHGTAAAEVAVPTLTSLGAG